MTARFGISGRGLAAGLACVAVLVLWPGCAQPPAAQNGAVGTPGAAPATSATSGPAPLEGRDTPDRVTATAPGEPVDGDWLVGRLDAEMPHLNPLTSTDAYASRLLDFIFDTMLRRNNETLELEPHLASSYEVSDDHLTYTFHLKQGVVFSDGQPLTSADVKFTFDKLMEPDVDAAPMRNYYQNIDRCETPDDYTARFYCKEPYYQTLIALGELPVLPRHIYETGDFNRHPNNRNPIGSGPYTLESWETNQAVTLVRNERYWGQKPHLLKRVYKIIVDDDTAFQVAERQELDTIGLRPEQWVREASAPEFESKFDKFSYYAPYHSYIGWNMRKPLFQDKMVRRALTMLLDRDTILKTIYHGLGMVVSGNFYINGEEYDKSIKPWPFDPAEARKLLDAAGWVDSNQNGTRDKDGQEFAFEVLIVNGSKEAEAMMTVYKEELKKAGIDMSIRTLEWASCIQNIHDHRFDAYVLGWSLGLDPDPYQLWHSSQTEKGSNYVDFVNAEADTLIEQARREFDKARRMALYHRLHAIQHEEQPYTFLFCSKALSAVDRRFRNVKVYPMGPDSREWYVPRELQRYGVTPGP